MRKQLLLGFGAMLTLSSAAFADGAAIATGDLNIRTGPGTGYAVIGVIPAEGAVAVSACLVDMTWCEVNYAGMAGWSAASYLAPLSGGILTTAVVAPAYAAAPVRTYAYTGDVATVAAPYGGEAVFAAATPRVGHHLGLFASTAPYYGYGQGVFASTAPYYGYRTGVFAATGPYDDYGTFASTEYEYNYAAGNNAVANFYMGYYGGGQATFAVTAPYYVRPY